MDENETKYRNVIVLSEEISILLPELMETISKTEFIEIWKSGDGNYNTIEEIIYKRM